MRIGFLNNQLDARGTGNAVYNYAHFNEEILGNESRIFTFAGPNHDVKALDKFQNRFGEIRLFDEGATKDLDLIYHIKSGRPDGVQSYGVPYAVHAVFEAEQHGDRYAVVSEWMGLRDNLPFVPHIVNPPKPNNYPFFRAHYGIPDDAVVFGRIGGFDSFDIPWVWDAIIETLYARPEVWFVMVNTQPIDFKSDRLLFLPPTLDEDAKSNFVAACNAMIHARMRGETFGISVGEFSIQGKTIFTYKDSYEKAHLFELRGTARTYENEEDLFEQLFKYNGEKSHAFYNRYTPERVMAKFKQVFIDDSDVEYYPSPAADEVAKERGFI